MLNIEQSVTDKFPGFAERLPIIRKSTLSILRKLTREQEINAFLREHQGQRGIDFIDRIFEYFNFNYSVSQRERSNIPAQGRVVIIANHPIGSLDGLALGVGRALWLGEREVEILGGPLRTARMPMPNIGSGRSPILEMV